VRRDGPDGGRTAAAGGAEADLGPVIAALAEAFAAHRWWRGLLVRVLFGVPGRHRAKAV
jgi:hypothetical protein